MSRREEASKLNSENIGPVKRIPAIAAEIACVRGLQKTPQTARMAFAMGRENGDWLYAAWPPAGSGGGLKWQTWQTFAIPKSRLSCLESGGREGIRTPGLLVANEALSQLSYSPMSSRQILAKVQLLANTRSTAHTTEIISCE